MKTERVGAIYDRLLGIHIAIDSQTIPNTRYINEKIGECHRYIEEVERFMFEVSKEISVLQQALNNSTAEYETKKEGLLTKNDEIRGLPSIKDREAKANSLLKAEMNSIRNYQNEVTDLNNLLKSINTKMKNLTRANGDIKMQLRVMESQIRLGMGPGSDDAMRSLAVEFAKSQIDKDSFAEATSSATETAVMDPAEPTDVNNLLSQALSPKLAEPVPSMDGSECTDPEEEEEEEKEEEAKEELAPLNTYEEMVEKEMTHDEILDKTLGKAEPDWNPPPTGGGPVVEEEETGGIDLDKVIDSEIKNKEGGAQKPNGMMEPAKAGAPEKITVPEQKKESKKTDANQIDIDDLLNSLHKK